MLISCVLSMWFYMYLPKFLSYYTSRTLLFHLFKKLKFIFTPLRIYPRPRCIFLSSQLFRLVLLSMKINQSCTITYVCRRKLATFTVKLWNKKWIPRKRLHLKTKIREILIWDVDVTRSDLFPHRNYRSTNPRRCATAYSWNRIKL